MANRWLIVDRPDRNANAFIPQLFDESIRAHAVICIHDIKPACFTRFNNAICRLIKYSVKLLRTESPLTLKHIFTLIAKGLADLLGIEIYPHFSFDSLMI